MPTPRRPAEATDMKDNPMGIDAGMLMGILGHDPLTFICDRMTTDGTEQPPTFLKSAIFLSDCEEISKLPTHRPIKQCHTVVSQSQELKRLLKNCCAWHHCVAQGLKMLIYCFVNSAFSPFRALFCLRSRRF
jgi:hypothetical protein